MVTIRNTKTGQTTKVTDALWQELQKRSRYWVKIKVSEPEPPKPTKKAKQADIEPEPPEQSEE